MADGDAGIEGWGREIQRRAAFFFADDSLISSTWPEWLQRSFDTLTGLFDLLGLRTNVEKTVCMVCQICRTVGKHSDEAYG